MLRHTPTFATMKTHHTKDQEKMADHNATIAELKRYKTRCEQAVHWGNGRRSKIALDHIPAMIEALEQDDQAAYQNAANEYTADMTYLCEKLASVATELPTNHKPAPAIVDRLLGDIETIEELEDLAGCQPPTPDGFRISRIEDGWVHVECWYSQHTVSDENGHYLFGGKVALSAGSWPLADTIALTAINEADNA